MYAVSQRITVVTGSASGIGAATRSLLESRGQRVIGVDLSDADVIADLATREGRLGMVEEVTRQSDGRVDSVISLAAVLSRPDPTVRVNYYGARATLDGLRTLLAESTSPRAVFAASVSAIHPVDEALLRLLDAGDEDAAVSYVATLPDPDEVNSVIYGTTKAGLIRWMRRVAAKPDWAGAGIAINAIAPGVVNTPMVASRLATAEGRERYRQIVPMPLNGIATPAAVACLIAWLAGAENSHVTGQVIFVDGGAETVQRGESTW